MPSLVPLQAGGAFIVVLAMFVLFLALVYWTYTDAKRNSTHPAFLWALVVFLAPLLGLVLYFLLGRDNRQYDRAPRDGSGGNSRKRPPM